MKIKTIIIFIFSFILLVVAGGSVWYMRAEILNKTELIKSHKLEEKQNRNFEFGNQLKKNGEILNTQEQLIKKVFLKSSEIVNFITYLESVGKDLGVEVTVEKIDYGTTESVENSYTIQPANFNVTLIGSYSQIKTFLGTVTNSDKILVTKEIKLYKSGEALSEYTARVIIEGIILTQ